MFGWTEHLGHLTGGGTMANLEALWVAGRLEPGKTILASAQAHYTHQRISGVLQLPFETIPCDARGRMDAEALRKRVIRGDVGTVVATMGTTATGSVDPLARHSEFQTKHGFRVHADAAYGGYFGLAGNLGPEARRSFDRLGRSRFHRHRSTQARAAALWVRMRAVSRSHRWQALPARFARYTYFSSGELHLGEISLECSRPGAAAVALWATQKLLPLRKGGEFAKGLEQCREAALDLYQRIAADSRFVAAFPPELDIVVFAPRAERVSESSAMSRRIFEAAARKNLHLALAELPAAFFVANLGGAKVDRDSLTCLRSVLMKPEHREWLDRIWQLLSQAVDESAG